MESLVLSGFIRKALFIELIAKFFRLTVEKCTELSISSQFLYPKIFNGFLDKR